MASTYIASYDDIEIRCSTTLPKSMECLASLQNPERFNGASIEFQIERPNHKTVDNVYFDGVMNCHTFAKNSTYSEVKYFSVDIKSGKFSIEVPYYDNDDAGTAFFRCVGTNIALPTTFGVLRNGAGTVIKNVEGELRIRAEYKRDDTTRQFADSDKYLREALVFPPIRTHGKDTNNEPINYLPLSQGISIESSGTIFDAKTGFKLILEKVQHKINQLEIENLKSFGCFPGTRFSSLAPYNTYYEKYFDRKYVNCTMIVDSVPSFTFNTTLVLTDDGFSGVVEFKTRNLESRGGWVPVNVNTNNTNIILSCPQLTVLKFRELPSFTRVKGYVAEYEGEQPVILSTSSALSFARLVLFSGVAAIIVLSLF